MPAPALSTPELAIDLADSVDDKGWSSLPTAIDDGPWLRVSRREGVHRLRFEEGGTFVVSDGGRRITVSNDRSTSSDTLRHLLIDQVIPLSLSHMGHVVLHAGAVVIDPAIAGAERGVAFIGPAGTGKSTLTASLANAGCVLLADDALVVSARGSQVLATPAYPGVRIWPEVVPAIARSERADAESLPRVAAYTNKRRLGARGRWRFADHPVTLRRVHVLDEHDEDGVLVEPMVARDALVALLSHTYVLDVSDRTRLEAQFARVFETSLSVEVRRLRYPRRLDRLDAVRAAILEDLQRP